VTADLRFTEPLYTIADAARYVGMPASTLASWARGYTRRFPERPDVHQGPVITCLEGTGPGSARVPFVGLVEAMVVQAFRQTGLPLQRVRRALDVLAQDGELEHPLASRRLYTDGAQILFDYATESGDKGLQQLTVVESGQLVFQELISEYLKRISFDEHWANELYLPITKARLLRVRPDVAFGDPVFLHGGAPLSAVVSRRKAGESVESIADDYGVPRNEIEEALGGILPQAA